MNNNKTTIYIIAAFVVGAIFPLVGILGGAFVLGCWWATRIPRSTKMCDPELLDDIAEWNKQERQRR